MKASTLESLALCLILGVGVCADSLAEAPGGMAVLLGGVALSGILIHAAQPKIHNRERDSTYAAEQIFNIIDSRSRSGLPLIVTTNMALEELEQPPTMQFARIYDRLLELCPIRIKLTRESRRVGNAQRRTELARELMKGD